MADGIGSSPVGGVASSLAVRSVLEDYYCTPESWPVRQSASRVIAAVNAWLHAQTKGATADPDRGYVCTLDVLILKGRTAHLFHVGDGRIWRRAGDTLEPMTEDHRVRVSSAQTYLARAIGAGPQVEIDALTVPIAPGDLFLLSTDGVHDHLAPAAIAAEIGDDLTESAERIVARALDAGSDDNLSVQLVRVEATGEPSLPDLLEGAAELPPAGPLQPGEELDGYRALRPLHTSARSQLVLAAAPDGSRVVLKLPSTEGAADPAYLRRFAAEEWVARRVENAHVMRHLPPIKARTRLYLVLEYLEGQTLTQWMRDNERPPPEPVRAIIEQVARGLDAFRRKAMSHGDLRPDNILIDAAGTARLLDFGSATVPGVAELDAEAIPAPLGTVQYSAPEVLHGAAATPAADVYSLGVIAYEMLTGRLPYKVGGRPGPYRPATTGRPGVPPWMDAALRKAVHPSPRERYQSAGELAADLRTPNPALVRRAVPLAERDPALFWKAVALVLAILLATALVGRFP